MDAECSKPYEILGVKPGVSVQELKAAHRDLAKVWHPDRFGHDVRLQKKAQEKLKEINEAYDQLISGKVPKSTSLYTNTGQQSSSTRSAGFDYSPRAYSTSVKTTSPRTPPLRWHWLALPLLIFVAVFFVTTRSLFRQRQAQLLDQRTQAEQAEPQLHNDATLRDSVAGAPPSGATTSNKTRAELEPGTETKPTAEISTETGTAQARPLATVTVLIDGSTGLLARPECPTKSRMTYPAGNEPHEYCNAHRIELTGGSSDSRVKSFAKKVVSPGKWVGSGGTKEKAGSDVKQND